MANASGPCANGKDWFELLNLSADPIDLSGCTLIDLATSGIVPGATVIGPEEYRVFVQTTELPDFEADNPVFYGGKPNLNKGGDKLELACGGIPIFSVEYGNGAGMLPLPADDGDFRVAVQLGMGPDVVVDANSALNPDNWCPATVVMVCGDKGTPGTENSSCD